MNLKLIALGSMLVMFFSVKAMMTPKMTMPNLESLKKLMRNSHVYDLNLDVLANTEVRPLEAATIIENCVNETIFVSSYKDKNKAVNSIKSGLNTFFPHLFQDNMFFLEELQRKGLYKKPINSLNKNTFLGETLAVKGFDGKIWMSQKEEMRFGLIKRGLKDFDAKTNFVNCLREVKEKMGHPSDLIFPLELQSIIESCCLQYCKTLNNSYEEMKTQLFLAFFKTISSDLHPPIVVSVFNNIRKLKILTLCCNRNFELYLPPELFTDVANMNIHMGAIKELNRASTIGTIGQVNIKTYE